MNILALDLGTTTGWAVSKRGLIHSGSQSFKPGRFEGGGMRYLKFAGWLDEVFTSHLRTSSFVAFEEVRRHMGVDAAHAYGGFLATLTQWCELRRIPYQGVPVATIKKFWSGKGNAKKDFMIKIAQERGFDPKDDNEADALALLHWAMHERNVAAVGAVMKEANEIAGDPSKRLAPDSKPRRRIQMGSAPVARRRIGG